MKTLLVTACVFLIVALIGHRACSSRVLDEMIFYEGSGLKLKVVTVYENVPLHFTGNTFRIQCQSDKTKAFVATQYSEKGWQHYLPIYVGFENLGYTSESEMSVDELARVAREGYRVTDHETLIVQTGNGLFITWNGCLSFRDWNFNELPRDLLIESTPEYEECRKKTEANLEWPHVQKRIETYGSAEAACQIAKFQGAGRPTISQLEATSDGAASATISSSAFKKSADGQIRTLDFGKTWRFEYVN
jgi:hypothetical protein